MIKYKIQDTVDLCDWSTKKGNRQELQLYTPMSKTLNKKLTSYVKKKHQFNTLHLLKTLLKR